MFKQIPVSSLFTPVALIGASFLALNLGVSYSFFHVNSYKLLVGLVCAVVILVFYQAKLARIEEETQPIGLLVLLGLPLVASLPGVLVNRLGQNYNFPYELASSLILWIWAFYLFQLLKGPARVASWVGWMSLVLAGTGLWGLAQGLGFFTDHNLLSGSVKSSFGHRNYFASYLVSNIPLFLMMLLIQVKKPGVVKVKLGYGLVLLLAVTDLALTQTRSAIAAAAVTLWLVLGVHCWRNVSGPWRKRGLMLLAGLALLGTVALVTYGVEVSADPVEGTRFEQLFSERAWIGRLIPWQAAWSAVQDSPLIGQGLGSFYNQFFLYQNPETRLYHPERSYNHAHSEPLEILCESGFLGGVIWLLGLYWVGRAVWRVLDRSDDLTQRAVALGLAGGILAFWLHGSFSVAPRMLVAELPYVLHIAALFALEAKVLSTPRLGEPAKRHWFKVNLVLIGVAGLLLAPWLQTQHEFIEALGMPNTVAKAKFLEQVTDQNKDIYALDHLLHLEQRLHRIPEMAKTIKKIESTIPHFRDVDYQKAVWAILRNKRDLAKTYALQAQAVDRYYLPTLRLLMNLSLESDDFPGFRDQFGLMTRLMLFHQFVIVAYDEKAVSLKNEATQLGVSFTFVGDQLEVRFDPTWLRAQYDQIRAVRRSNPTRFERQQVREQRAYFVEQNPFFRLEVRPEFLADEAEVSRELDQYKQISRDLVRQAGFLEFSLAQDLRTASPAQAAQLRQSYQQRYDRYKEKPQAQLAQLQRQLDEKTQFHQFINKHKFATAWLGEWQRLYLMKDQKDE